jgi:hypothetical protein
VPGGGVWRHGSRGDARALPYREAGSGAVGLDLCLVRRDTQYAGYRQVQLGMQVFHVVPEELTKWNLQTLLILAVIPFQ